MKRHPLLPALVAALAASSFAGPAAGVVGGTAAPVQSAPWTVSIRQVSGRTATLCTGAVIDATHVLTAAHCVFTLAGAPALPSALTVRAGVSSYAQPLGDDAEQDRAVASVRVHPGYVWSSGASPDDVAVVALTAPLDLGGSAVQAAALPAPGSAYPAGVPVAFAAFGREDANAQADGSLHTLAMTVDPQGSCGGLVTSVVPGASAVALCASSPGGSICNGDSGGALVRADDGTIVGVASAGTVGCATGSHGIFTYLGAPEILAFLQGSDQPPTAPRVTASTYLRIAPSGLGLRVGGAVTCASSNWEGSPTLAFTFVDAGTGQVLQQGPSATLALTPREAGMTIACRVSATNAGGTAVLTTPPTAPVAAAPAPTILPLAAATLVRGRSERLRVVLRVPGGAGDVAACVTPPAAVAPRACASERLGPAAGRVPLLVTLRVKPTAPLGVHRVAITASAGTVRATSTAQLRVAAR